MFSAEERGKRIHKRAFDGVTQGTAPIVIQYSGHIKTTFHLMKLFAPDHPAGVIGKSVDHFTDGSFLLFCGKC